MGNQTMQPLLSKSEASKILGIAQVTLDRLRKSGALKAIKVGKLVKFKLEDLQNLNYEEVVNN